MVLQEIEELGFYRGKEDRSSPALWRPFNVVIEPMLTEQW
jgi:hypothetical protein